MRQDFGFQRKKIFSTGKRLSNLVLKGSSKYSNPKVIS
jgi:hypothetical protein